ncbi:MAG: AgmX/PglI C-terminal domain-containing protein [Myxococcales bacterium]|nr:AgmX/PglI C-terminal domain-containing protein [Myxococcales bacterium]
MNAGLRSKQDAHAAVSPSFDDRADLSLEVSVRWKDVVLDAIRVRRSRAITLGPLHHRKAGRFDLEVDGELPSLSGSILVDCVDDQTLVWVPEGVDVDVVAESSETTEASTGPKVLLPGERLSFTYGGLTYEFDYRRTHVPILRRPVRDRAFLGALWLASLVHIALILAFSSVSLPTLEEQQAELQRRHASFVQVRLKAVVSPALTRRRARPSGAPKGRRAPKQAGLRGEKSKKKPKDTAPPKPGNRRVRRDRKERDRQVALNTGLLGALRKKANRSKASAVLGPGELGAGISAALGGLRGQKPGVARGARGLGTRGTGTGGGGSLVGIGSLGTGLGQGGGGEGSVNLGGRGRSRARIRPAKTKVLGSLTRSEVARVIRLNLPRFKFCYEKELSTTPDLMGKVSVRFVIAPNGLVSKARIQESTLDHETVTGCVVRVMSSLKFPKPRGGGVAEVTYPFIFTAS